MDEIDLEIYADAVTDVDTRHKIRQEYRKRWPEPSPTPDSHPWQYDPLEPPSGWRYDPYYEIWIKT